MQTQKPILARLKHPQFLNVAMAQHRGHVAFVRRNRNHVPVLRWTRHPLRVSVAIEPGKPATSRSPRYPSQHTAGRYREQAAALNGTHAAYDQPGLALQARLCSIEALRIQVVATDEQDA